ncbi:hypothetical protein IFM89_011656 [Coptis chinensis]|uniref:Terpene synthase N-terminal domain-containing protein n=1 Tax=Coptis chinensis TaxID=261450 RepID=A0A835HX85_9MAGN|nr:hypothetical protein IFM89_011656 [Coptis chinensis]
MALRLLSLPISYCQTRLTLKHGNAVQEHPSNISITKNIHCIARAETIEPTAKHQANFWDYDYMMSLGSDYTDETQNVRVQELKEHVKHLLDELDEPLAKLELIDAIERLGVGNHFEEEILDILQIISVDRRVMEDLYSTALRFRLLRKHGYDVPQEIFKSFQDEMGNFKSCLTLDTEGMLSLYEASYLGFEGDNIMDEAKCFTTKHLKNPKEYINPTLAKRVEHSLELALHLRLPTVEARWYIYIYGSEENMTPALLQLAILNYNMVQGVHQKEIGTVARWWMGLGLQNLSFLRDRMMMNFFWSMAIICEPKFGHFREELTKVTMLLTVIDDMYETHGSLEELDLFTDAVERWNVSAMEQLPQHMKLCYMALLNTNNNIGYQWVKLCKAYFMEAKWVQQRYTPTTKEYFDNGIQSIAVPLTMINCYFLTAKTITEEALERVELIDSLIYLPSMILRLGDDLITSTDEQNRGSKQCYMDELGVSEEGAREHIRQLICDNWKKMNKARVSHHPFSEPFTSATTNLCRIAECFSLLSHGQVDPNASLENLMSTIFEPISLM